MQFSERCTNESFHNARNMSQGTRRTSRSKGASSVYQTCRKGSTMRREVGAEEAAEDRNIEKCTWDGEGEKESRKQQKVKPEKQNAFIRCFAGRVPVVKGSNFDNLLSTSCCNRQVPSCLLGGFSQVLETDDHTHK